MNQLPDNDHFSLKVMMVTKRVVKETLLEIFVLPLKKSRRLSSLLIQIEYRLFNKSVFKQILKDRHGK